MNGVPCPGCKALFPDTGEMTHPYIGASAGCWARYGEILAKEYSSPRYRAIHRFTADTYAVQHPGKSDDRRCIQSVGLHLIALCMGLELHLEPDAITKSMKRILEDKVVTFHWLEPPADPGSITIAAINPSAPFEVHEQQIIDWARCVWNSWSVHHPQIKTWCQTVTASWL